MICSRHFARWIPPTAFRAMAWRREAAGRVAGFVDRFSGLQDSTFRGVGLSTSVFRVSLALRLQVPNNHILPQIVTYITTIRNPST